MLVVFRDLKELFFERFFVNNRQERNTTNTSSRTVERYLKMLILTGLIECFS